MGSFSFHLNNEIITLERKNLIFGNFFGTNQKILLDIDNPLEFVFNNKTVK